jgi:hypothetical protein
MKPLASVLLFTLPPAVREAVFVTILPPPLVLDPAAQVLQGGRHLEDTRDQASVYGLNGVNGVDPPYISVLSASEVASESVTAQKHSILCVLMQARIDK